MAGRGFAPTKAAADIEVTADGKLRGPALPKDLPWPPQTVEWWKNWRRSAQAQRMEPTDWDFMLDTALLHARMWDGDGSVAAELRLRVAKFGATLEDRARLKMAIVAPEPKSKSKSSVRDRRLRVVDSQASQVS